MRGTAATSVVLGVLALPMFTVVLLSSRTAANACTSSPAQQTAGVTNQAIVTTAYTEATHRGVSDRVMLALFEAGLDESSFRNLANQNVVSSLAIAHDGVGADHTSVGYLQQQVGADGSGVLFGWGDVAQAMDPVHATDAFLNAAIPLDATITGDAATLAQAVQRSATADGSNYRGFQVQAAAMIAAQAGGVSGSDPSAAAPSSDTVTPWAVPSRPVGKLSPTTGAYVGAFSSRTGLATAQEQEAYFQSREGLAGRGFAIHNDYPGWATPLDTPLVRWDLAHGIIPMISWSTPTGMTDAEVTAGGQDALITAQADRLKALGQAVFLRFDWEMNGDWFPWDGTHNGGPGVGPGAFVAMWRHVHAIFDRAGAANVVWVWSPQAQSNPDVGWNSWAGYYPGDDDVDWVGVDAYNYGGTHGDAPWTDLTPGLRPIYTAYSTRKPIMIAETGSVDGIPGHDKGQWVADLQTSLPHDFPDVQALVWFDDDYSDGDWRFDTSPSALAAFRTLMADPYFNPSSRAETVGGSCTGDGGDGDPSPAPGTTTSSTLPNGLTITGSPAGITAVHYALAQLGKPYVWGTAGPDSYDCSGLTMAAWATAGVSLPHFTGDQVNAGTPEPLDLTTAQAGDLVFIPGSDGTPTNPRHVGMVAGTITDTTGTHLYLIDAPHTGADVELLPVTVWAGRIVDVRHLG